MQIGCHRAAGKGVVINDDATTGYRNLSLDKHNLEHEASTKLNTNISQHLCQFRLRQASPYHGCSRCILCKPLGGWLAPTALVGQLGNVVG